MAQFTGFTCDDCSEVVASEDRVRQIVRLESDHPGLSGEARIDLCPDCARSILNGSDLIFRPLRRRRKAVEDAAEEEAEQVEVAVPLPTG